MVGVVALRIEEVVKCVVAIVVSRESRGRNTFCMVYGKVVSEICCSNKVTNITTSCLPKRFDTPTYSSCQPKVSY